MNLRKLAKGKECTVRIPQVCNHNPETTVLAHLNGAGLALKHPDLLGAWCCSSCHDVYDGRMSIPSGAASIFEPCDIDIAFYEGIFRTQQQLLKMGLQEVIDAWRE